MTLKRKINYRNKGDSIIIEGKQKGKRVFIWTLPDPEALINLLLENESYFPIEKINKIKSKLAGLDTMTKKPKNPSPKVLLITTMRTFEKDSNNSDSPEVTTFSIPSSISLNSPPENTEKKRELTEQEIKELWELTKD